MTTHKLIEVLKDYEDYLVRGYKTEPVQLSDQEYMQHALPPEKVRNHLHWMIRRIVDFLIPSGDMNEILKAHRWLGYIQGELRAMQEFSIFELRGHSRTEK